MAFSKISPMIVLLIFVISIFAGFLGSLLGLGGGIIVVPILSLVVGVDIKYAVAASLIAVVATSSGAAASFLKDHLTNLRLAVILEVGTVLGAIVGFLISAYINSKFLFTLFGGILMFSAIMMLRKKVDNRGLVNHPIAEKLNLAGSYTEKNGQLIEYKVENVPGGLTIMFIAGVLSAVLGIGSGIFKVIAMDSLMKIPMKVSSATSNFMIGVTAAASAGAYLIRGDIRPEVAGPVAVGIIVGSYYGAKVMPKLPTAIIKKVFIFILMITAAQMLYKGLK